MAQQDVIDELIVKLTLDAEEYRNADARIERETDRTYRKQQERARGTDKSNRNQQKRLSEVASSVKAFGVQVAAAVGVVTGLGAAVIGTLGGFLGFETALRRQTVGTALSNKQMQAWGATARRLGADADAGADAIANLSKERQQFEYTGNAPTMQALARMGVNVDKGRPLEDVLAQAQQIYRGAPEGQKQQIENTLSAQGVSPDLILMIKSETDVREAFTKSLSQATDENRKALDALADAFESIKATSITVAGTLAEALKPAIEDGAKKLAEFATELASFTKDVQAAGGGVEGFQSALDKHAPLLGQIFEGLRIEGQLLKDVWSVGRNQVNEFMRALSDLGSWIMYFLNKARNPFGTGKLGDALVSQYRKLTGTSEDLSTGQRAALAAYDWWDKLTRSANAANANRDGVSPPSTKRDGVSSSAANSAPLPASVDPADKPARTGAMNVQQLMQLLTSRYGLTVPQAAAVASNFYHESGLRPNAVNPVGGGTGARGLAQWRGDRTAAFVKQFGVTPDKATFEQQVEFAMTNPAERARLNKAFAVGGSAAQLGTSVSKIYEAHGNVAQDIERGRTAEKFAAQAGAQTTNTSQVSINTVNVQTDNPRDFVAGLQRIDTSQAYNTVIR